MMGMRGPNAWSLHQARSADLWGYMLCAGKACFTVEGQNQFELSAGDVVVVPAGAEHGIRSVGSPAAELSYAHYSYDERRAAALFACYRRHSGFRPTALQCLTSWCPLRRCSRRPSIVASEIASRPSAWRR